MFTALRFYFCDIQKHWNSKAEITWENDSVLLRHPTYIFKFILFKIHVLHKICACLRKFNNRYDVTSIVNSIHIALLAVQLKND